jgi:putative phosphoesterase
VGIRIRVGVISDTHRLLRPEAQSALLGVDHIIHAGDIGSAKLLKTLQGIAPLTIVRGNTDTEAWARKIPKTATVQLGQVHIYVIHDLDELDLDPQAEGFRVVVAGHTHCAKQTSQNGVLFFNPGSAGPRRFHYPVTLGYLAIEGKSISDSILELED